MSRKLIRRTALLGLLLPCLYFGTASATFLYRIHAGNSARAGLMPPSDAPPARGQRLLIFSPHPDDETLGCGGLIQQALHARADVRVVMFTNGDGFRVAVERQMRKLRVGPSDYIRFANLRQEETFEALENLGLSRTSVQFMGYPDRGLLPLWSDNWAADRPYTSPYTRASSSPYERAVRPGVSYSGESVLQSVKDALRDFKPTDVYITHPSDDHPDHSAASSFVTLGFDQLQSQGEPWSREAKLHYYLVHRGDWPVPQGTYKSDSLTPPGEMCGLDTAWSARPLTNEQVDRKEKSILTYASQTAVMKRFLVSFARKSEVFGSLEPVTMSRVADGAVTADGSVNEWKEIPPVLLDPVNDSLLRDFQGGADVKAVYACRDSSTLYLRIDTYHPETDQVEVRLKLRYFGDTEKGSAGGTYAVTARPPRSVVPSEVRVATQGNRLEMAIPLRSIGYSKRIALNVDTLFAGIQVDRTGFRFLTLEPGNSK